MDSKEAQSQIAQMISFIAAEAADKANEIQKKGEEEFSIEVHRLITEQKEKVRQGYEKKVKQIETKYAIARSMAINKQRLEKIKARQEVMHKIENDARAKLVSEAQAPAFVTKLIVQGLLMLLEDKVTVRCRKADESLVKGCLAGAQAEYAKLIKAETGATKDCALVIDTEYLPAAPEAGKDGPSCLGGVLLHCQAGKISIDNTVDVRLRLVMEQAKPAIRSLLFPAS
mmetsp:Transcript_119085/g.344437  ORF Transcript_119085/g.344437 Transcript_119085/m.344437 type:complete len:228 (-) Transcript_119085:91-774(-)